MEFISRAVTLTTFYKSPKIVNVFEKHPNRTTTMTAAHFRKTVFSSSSITRSQGPRATSAADGSPAYKGFDKCFNFKVHKSFQIKRRKSATMLVELTLANV